MLSFFMEGTSKTHILTGIIPVSHSIFFWVSLSRDLLTSVPAKWSITSIYTHFLRYLLYSLLLSFFFILIVLRNSLIYSHIQCSIWCNIPFHQGYHECSRRIENVSVMKFVKLCLSQDHEDLHRETFPWKAPCNHED